MAKLNVITGAEWNGVQYFTTQRSGGFSQGHWSGLNLAEHCFDDPLHVAQNRQLLQDHLPSVPHWLNQVHGTGIYQACKALHSPISWSQAPIADAAWTETRQTVLAILTADCLPIVIADNEGSIVGAVHAGWRGLAAGVVEKLLVTLRAQRPKATGWRVWIGPAISQSVFEVGAEVRQVFIEKNKHIAVYFSDAKETNKYYVDLNQIAVFLLRALQIENLTIELSNACTYLDEKKYYSYRRQAQTGRICTLVWLK